MERISIAMFLLAAFTFTFSPGGLPEPAMAQTLPFKTIAQGQISSYCHENSSFEGSEMVIQDLKTWKWFWKRHTQGMLPAPTLPKVDFSEQLVLVAMLGYQTTGGVPSIEITRIEKLAKDPVATKAIRVLVATEKKPGPLDIITNPFHIVAVKKAGSVVFDRQPLTPSLSCHENSACDAESYCAKDTGDCNGSGSCKTRPDACPMIHAPVCGCDDKTYSSGCMAAGAGVSVLHEGECRKVVPMD